ncbi:MAG: hypothetical protein NC311_05860 [Muribaculaceae bacterium]|nr:hypothetical protein [Muribaculaceae bacterium]
MPNYDQFVLSDPPDTAYYNNNNGTAIQDYNEIRKTDKTSYVFSWSTRYLKIWDMLIMRPDLSVPVMPPPPLYIDRSTNTPGGTDGDGEKLMILGHMAESWASSTENPDRPIASKVFYQLRLYENAIKKEIKSLAGKTPTYSAANAILDRIMLHEMCHYIRNTAVWRRCYLDDTVPYNEAFSDMRKALTGMGETEDERLTEALALFYFLRLYFGCCKGALTPKDGLSPWLKFLEKKYPASSDAIKVYRYYELEWMYQFGEHTNSERDRIIVEQSEIISALKHSGKKHGQKLILIQ